MRRISDGEWSFEADTHGDCSYARFGHVADAGCPYLQLPPMRAMRPDVFDPGLRGARMAEGMPANESS